MALSNRCGFRRRPKTRCCFTFRPAAAQASLARLGFAMARSSPIERGKINGATFSAFLKALDRGNTPGFRRVVVITGNAHDHHARRHRPRGAMRADSSSINHRTARFAGPLSDRTGLEIYRLSSESPVLQGGDVESGGSVLSCLCRNDNQVLALEHQVCRVPKGRRGPDRL
jgi:hypothetical protein